MNAQAAAVAEAGIDERLATLLAARAARVGVEADAGTADLGDALLAARARFGIHDGGRVRLHQLDARRLEQDGAGAFVVERLAHGRHRRIEVERVRMHDAIEADGLQHARDGDGLALRPHERDAGAGMRLRAGHGRGGVVQHAHGDVVAVVHGVHQARQPAGEERGVAHERQRLLVRLGHGEALRHRDARAHAQAGVHGVQRHRVAQRVAADVAAQHGGRLPQRALHRVEAAAMGAARAKHGRAHGQRRVGRRIVGECFT